MSEEKKDHKVQIWVAIIGLVGVIGAAIIGNWDKLVSTNKNMSNDISHESIKNKDSENNDLPKPTKVPISYQGKGKYLEVKANRTASYNNSTLTFKEWGFVSSEGKIINTDVSSFSFKLRMSTDALKDNQGKIWKPRLYVVFSESSVNKENMYSLQGTELIFPSEKELSIKSKYGQSVTSKYKGENILKPSVWHDVNISFSGDTVKVKVNNTNIMGSEFTISGNSYYLHLKSWSSADFQIKDLVIK